MDRPQNSYPQMWRPPSAKKRERETLQAAAADDSLRQRTFFALTFNIPLIF
jgi:hypothetical protein